MPTVLPDKFLRCMPKAERKRLGKSGLLMEELILRDRIKTEKQFQENILAYLRLHNIVAGRQRMDKKSNMAVGWPDFVFAVPPGIPVAFESKLPGQDQTPEQKDMQKKMEANGWRYFVVHDMHEVKNILESIENHNPKN